MAAYSDLRLQLHALMDQLDPQQIEQAEHALEIIRQNSLAATLRTIPGLRVPPHWPPRYRSVEALTVSGGPASEQLVRERR